MNRILECSKSNDPQFEVRRMTAGEIWAVQRSQTDVLIHPGDSGSKQGKTLGAERQKAITKFGEGAGGFLGVYAGDSMVLATKKTR